MSPPPPPEGRGGKGQYHQNIATLGLMYSEMQHCKWIDVITPAVSSWRGEGGLQGEGRSGAHIFERGSEGPKYTCNKGSPRAGDHGGKGGVNLDGLVREKERESERGRGRFTSSSHISLWEHSSHLRLIGRDVPSVSVVSQLVYNGEVERGGGIWSETLHRV